MLDLHMHTRYSDGSDEVSMVLEKAEKLKLKCIAITDHNTCLEYNELKDEKIRSLFSGKIIPGVELNTKVLGIPIEILGYNVDTDLLQKYIDETYMSNEERCKLEVERLYSKCISEGILLPEDFVEKYDGSMYASKYLHSLITKDENNYRHISVGKKLKNQIFWDAINMYDQKVKDYTKIEHLKGIFSFALSIEKKDTENFYSENMKYLIKIRGYDSLKELIKDLGSDVDKNDNKAVITN